ncbi:MAG: PepSY domain-containing protein [Pseudomonadota bacterium]|nr:PepSY domain-containing protein [Pseudomonadota bacterium]
MKNRLALLWIAPLCSVVLVPAVPALAAPGDAQGEVRRELHSGMVRPLREIEQHVLPTMPGMQYLGPEYDPLAMAYRLKFIRDGRVVFVDVDARTGQIIHESH